MMQTCPSESKSRSGNSSSETPALVTILMRIRMIFSCLLELVLRSTWRRKLRAFRRVGPGACYRAMADLEI